MNTFEIREIAARTEDDAPLYCVLVNDDPIHGPDIMPPCLDMVYRDIMDGDIYQEIALYRNGDVKITTLTGAEFRASHERGIAFDTAHARTEHGTVRGQE